MGKILLVNDCKFESIIIKDMLEEMGHEVKISNEDTALKDIDTYYPEILICNLIMKHTTGDIIIDKAKKKYPHIKGILSSSNDLSLDTYSKKGIDDIVKTPVSKEKLGQVLTVRDKKIKFCPYCGEKLEKVFKFCPECGEKL